jgi:hypothetical protein
MEMMSRAFLGIEVVKTELEEMVNGGGQIHFVNVQPLPMVKSRTPREERPLVSEWPSDRDRRG